MPWIHFLWGNCIISPEWCKVIPHHFFAVFCPPITNSFLLGMPRTYNTKLGAWRYADYNEDTLKECLDCIRNGELSWEKTSAKYNIPFRIIENTIKKYHQQRPGRPPVFRQKKSRLSLLILKLLLLVTLAFLWRVMISVML
jgi:hypothetical protein